MSHEITIRVTLFFGILLLIMLLERIFPRRVLRTSRSQRWPSNIAIVIINSLFVRLILPLSGVALAGFVQSRGWGILNLISLPVALTVIVSIVLLDMAIYFQHIMFHAIPLFWRLHQMHHADMEIDVTTGSRFHPIEILLSMLIKFSVIIMLGISPLAVLLFEIILNATAMFNHANLRIPKKTDRILRLFVVTPDMHRIHHSVERKETDSNFGFSLPWWDHLFGTYRAQPHHGHTGMYIGLRNPRNKEECQSLFGMLLMPFRNTEKMGN